MDGKGYADDGGFQPDGAIYNNAKLIPGAGPPWGQMSGSPTGPNFPICFSAVPEGPAPGFRRFRTAAALLSGSVQADRRRGDQGYLEAVVPDEITRAKPDGAA